MEQGFSDACTSLCLGQRPVPRVAQSCRSAAIEMPRPTVRKWCEHGYNIAYSKTKAELATHFLKEAKKNASSEQVEDESINSETSEIQEKTHSDSTNDENQIETTLRVLASIPVTLDENTTHEVVIYEGQNVEDSVVSFCREYVRGDLSACIRHLLPEVLNKYNQAESGLRG